MEPDCAASGRPGAEPSALEVPPSRRRGRAPAFPPCRVTAAPPAERGAGGRAARGDDRDPRGWQRAARRSALVTRGAKFRRRRRASELSGRVLEGRQESDLGPPREPERRRTVARRTGGCVLLQAGRLQKPKKYPNDVESHCASFSVIWPVFSTFPKSADF